MVSAQLPDRISFQKRAVTRLVREIAATDRRAESYYVRQFVREFRSYEAITDLPEIIYRASEADVVYIGDYHALAVAQEFACSLVEQLARCGRPLALGLELFYGRNQRTLNEYLAGHISEEELLLRVQYHAEWGFSWESYAPLLRLAREYQWPCLALDCSPRTDLRLMSRRDASAAKKIADFLTNQPDTLLCVLFGEAHLASNHLPGKVRAQLNARGIGKRDMVILQNIDTLYWRLAEERPELAPAVRIDQNKYCVFNTSPLAKYAAYRQHLEHWQADHTDPDLTPAVHHIIETLLAFLRLNQYSYCLTRSGRYAEYLIDYMPEVYSLPESEASTAVLNHYDFSRSQQDQILTNLAEKGCYYAPELNAFFVHRLNIEAIAEEASRFLQHVFSGRVYDHSQPKWMMLPPDRFYTQVLMEALNRFCARLVLPHGSKVRPIDGGAAEYHNSLMAEQLTPAEVLGVTDLLQQHERFIRRQKHSRKGMPGLQDLQENDACWTWVTRLLGQQLGEQMSASLARGALSRTELRKLFTHLSLPASTAFRTYLRVFQRTRS